MKRLRLLIKFITFVVFFSLYYDACFSAEMARYLSEPLWKSYISTWLDKRETVIDYDLHERMAYRITLAKDRDLPSIGYSNIASFSLSVQNIGSWHHTVLPFIISSCDIPVETNSTAFYWQKSGSDFSSHFCQ